MPTYKARRKAPKVEQLTEPLRGELETYRKFGLYQRDLARSSVYRYTGVLKIYQRALNGREPTVETSKLFLARLREDGFDPNTLKVYRSALQDFHEWRGESLVFPIKVPHRQPKYVEPQLPATMLELAQDNYLHVLILRLMTEAGLRRGEVASLKAGQVGEDALRIRGKGGRERTIPISQTLKEALKPFCAGKDPSVPVVGVSRKVIYRVIKHYAKLAGQPALKPHDLRHAFGERLVERGANLRAVQELMGHQTIATTEKYIGVTASHLKQTIALLDSYQSGPKPGRGMPWDSSSHRMSWELPENQSPAEQERAARREEITSLYRF